MTLGSFMLPPEHPTGNPCYSLAAPPHTYTIFPKHNHNLEFHYVFVGLLSVAQHENSCILSLHVTQYLAQ